MSQPSLEAFSRLVDDQLALIEERLLAVVQADNPYVSEAARHVISAGGKRFRPALVVLTSQFGQSVPTDRLVRAALVMELTHVASLYHDDVMDEAQLRRAAPSANLRYGNSVAILVGDFLFSRASSEVALLGTDYVALQARTFARLVQGQIAETLGPGPGADPMEHYLRVIEDKTASLIEASARFGAMVAQSTPQVLDALARFGHEIGMAFQLSDDLIDVTSDVTGKIPGTDLREGVPTLPVLMLGDSPQDRDLRRRIADGLHSDAEVASVVGTLRESPVIERSRSVIAQHAEQARGYLNPLPEGAPKQALIRLCEDVVDRSR